MNRNTPRKMWGAASAASIVTIALIGCNTILDNERGELAQSEPFPTDPAPSTEDAGTSRLPRVDEPEDAGTRDSGRTPAPDAGTPPPQDAGGAGCQAGQQLCHGVCVSMTDPLYGCGHPSCAPCASAHSTAACQGRSCVVASCDNGYADCNGNPADGCETDLSKATTCGACNAVCPAANPVCAPAGGGFQCTTGCGPTAPLLCGNECVNPQTSVNHCGGCNVKCNDVPNAKVACTNGACTFTCKAGYHACGGTCVVNTDPAACGPACTACPRPANSRAICANDACSFQCEAGFHACGGACVAANDPAACGPTCAVCPAAANARPTCANDACAFQCEAGFADCNANAADGCEARLADDVNNCGACGTVCAPAGSTCVNGVCQPPPDAGGG